MQGISLLLPVPHWHLHIPVLLLVAAQISSIRGEGLADTAAWRRDEQDSKSVRANKTFHFVYAMQFHSTHLLFGCFLHHIESYPLKANDMI